MADHTQIEWTDATWNPITGCSVVSAGCKHCYAMKLAGTRLQHHPSRAGLTIDTAAGPVWNGQVRLNEEWLDQPLRWRRPRRIFVCAHGDLFHESVPDEWIDRVFATMALAPQHTFQVLTKRAARMRAYLTDSGTLARVTALLAHAIDGIGGAEISLSGVVDALPGFFLPNVWLGVSVENQDAAAERIPLLLMTPAAVRWISAEPMLGPVNLIAGGRIIDYGHLTCAYDALTGDIVTLENETRGQLTYTGKEVRRRRGYSRGIDWVVAGGESGPHARPMNLEWVRSLRDHCAEAGVPFLFKQWGEWLGFDHRSSCIGVDAMTGGLTARVDGRSYSEADVVGWFPKGDHRAASFSVRVGKKAAGRLLDGVLHDSFPEVR